MLNKILLILILTFSPCTYVYSYEHDNEYIYEDERVETRDYCSPKVGIKEKLKKAFSGTPTGFTPHSGNNWTSHNIYNPINQYKLYGKSF